MKDKCSYADEYKVIRPPTCGCKTCHDKWEKKLSRYSKGPSTDDIYYPIENVIRTGDRISVKQIKDEMHDEYITDEEGIICTVDGFAEDYLGKGCLTVYDITFRDNKELSEEEKHVNIYAWITYMDLIISKE